MRFMLVFAASVALASAASAGPSSCSQLDAAEITGKDLAAVLPVFRVLPPDLALGSMPLPGSRRTFRAAELAALALRHSVRLDPVPDVCFEWPMQPLSRDRVLAAMQAALPDARTRIEIVETSLYPTPPGRLDFAASALGRPASPDSKAPVLWRGEVVYGGGRRYAVWARVRVSGPCERVTAAVNLRPGAPIAAGQLRVQTMECFPHPSDAPATPEQFIGLAPLRPIPAGAELRAAMLTPLNDVARGDMIEVEARSGAARLTLLGKAEAAGRVGDVIAVRNPGSNRLFQARIDGKAHAIVSADSSGGR